MVSSGKVLPNVGGQELLGEISDGLGCKLSQDASHQQDYYIFCIPISLHFATITGKGDNQKDDGVSFATTFEQKIHQVSSCAAVPLGAGGFKVFSSNNRLWQ